MMGRVMDEGAVTAADAWSVVNMYVMAVIW